MHGVGVDGDLPNDISDRRKLVARVQKPEIDGLTDLIEELTVGGNPRARIEPEADERSFDRLSVLA